MIFINSFLCKQNLFLENPEDHGSAATSLRELRRIWSDEESETIIGKSIPLLKTGNTSQIEWSEILIREAVLGHMPKNAEAALEAILTSLSEGNLSLDGTPEALQFQVDSLEQVNHSVQVGVRGLIIDELSNYDRDPSSSIALALQLINISASQHSDTLLQPVVDYALLTENDEWRNAAIGLLDTMDPSEDAKERSRDSLAELGSKFRGNRSNEGEDTD